MSAININKNNFQNEIMNSEKPVLLDFWAPWCAPCRMLAPVVEEIASERADIKVGKINIDEQSELANKFGIMSIPTLAVMKNGKIIPDKPDASHQSGTVCGLSSVWRDNLPCQDSCRGNCHSLSGLLQVLHHRNRG